MTFAATYVFWKDLNSVYLGCNNNVAKAAGLDHPDEIRGKTDFDLAWADTDADLYQEGDEEVFDGLIKTNVIETQLQANGKHVQILINKLPLTDIKGQKIGVVGSYTVIENPDACLMNRILPYNLSQRQFDCLLYLVQGLSCKQIGKRLKLSPRTVEYYLTIIKNKLGCFTRSELINKAFTLASIKEKLCSVD